MECPKCGTHNPVESKHCTSCGEYILEEEAKGFIPKSTITYVIAETIDDAVLAEGESFEDYVQRIDATKPYGTDPEGVAHLFPMGKHKGEKAWREGMEYRSDWGGFRRTGIGWKLNPTIIIILILFVPVIFLLPLVYLFYVSPEFYMLALIRELSIQIPLILLGVFLVLLTGYGTTHLDDLLKPYGKDHGSVKLLFKDDLEYLKFSRKLIWEVSNYKWMKIGAIGFFAYLFIGFQSLWDLELWRSGALAPIPDWSRFLIIPATIGTAVLVFFIITFILGIGIGLFKIGNLGADRSKLSISAFGNMIADINDMITEAQLKKVKLSDFRRKLDVSGRTYYEFQRGNRKIGEFLFNITAILIFLSVTAGIIIWVIGTLNLLGEGLEAQLASVAVITTLFGILSFGIFLFPQLSIHKFLKKFKLTLIDTFSILASRLEYLYFEAMIHPEILAKIDEEWTSRRDLLEDIHLIKELIEEIKGYGTWSYDFPEIMKLVVVAAATMIPILLSFVELPI